MSRRGNAFMLLMTAHITDGYLFPLFCAGRFLNDFGPFIRMVPPRRHDLFNVLLADGAVLRAPSVCHAIAGIKNRPFSRMPRRIQNPVRRISAPAADERKCTVLQMRRLGRCMYLIIVRQYLGFFRLLVPAGHANPAAQTGFTAGCLFDNSPFPVSMQRGNPVDILPLTCRIYRHIQIADIPFLSRVINGLQRIAPRKTVLSDRSNSRGDDYGNQIFTSEKRTVTYLFHTLRHNHSFKFFIKSKSGVTNNFHAVGNDSGGAAKEERPRRSFYQAISFRIVSSIPCIYGNFCKISAKTECPTPDRTHIGADRDTL